MGEERTSTQNPFFPVFFASYDYTLLGHLGIGAAFAYDHYHSDIKMSGWYNGNGGTRTEDYFTIAATARLNYMNFTYVRLYAFLDGGVCILRQTDEWDFDKTETTRRRITTIQAAASEVNFSTSSSAARRGSRQFFRDSQKSASRLPRHVHRRRLRRF